MLNERGVMMTRKLYTVLLTLILSTTVLPLNIYAEENTEEPVEEQTEIIEETEEIEQEEETIPEEISEEEPVEIIPEETVSEEEIIPDEGTEEEPSEEAIAEEESAEEEVTSVEEPEEEIIPEEESSDEEISEPVQTEIPEETTAPAEEPEEAVQEPEEVIEEETEEEPEVYETGDGSFTVGDYVYTVSNGVASVTKYKGTASSVTLPTEVTISGSLYKLTSLGDGVFDGNQTLKSVTIPKEYRIIGKIAFRNCTNLKTVKIMGDLADCSAQSLGTASLPTTVNTMYNSVFYNAGTNTDGMTVTFGSGVTRIPAYLFATGYDYVNNTYAHVKTVKLSSTITYIGTSAFDRCYDLTTVNFTDAKSLQTIDVLAFHMTGLKAVSFANKLLTIQTAAFSNIEKLKTVELPKSLRILGNAAFRNCTNLTSVTINGNLPDCSAKSIDSGTSYLYTDSSDVSVFYNTGTNTNGMTVTFASGVTRIPAYMFATGYSYASNVYAHVKKVVIPNSVKTIGAYAFCNCYDITAVNIKRNSLTIEGGAFTNDTKIKASVYYGGPAHKAMQAYTSSFAYYAPQKTSVSTLTTTEDGIIVSWEAAVGAKTYYVYRKVGTGSYKKITEVSKLQYFDKAAKTDGKKYTYMIKGVVGTKIGTASDAKAVTYKKTSALKKGWLQKNDAWYYINDDYSYATGWKKVGTKWYYFANNGKMVTSWKKINGVWYYFAASGAMATGWKKIGGKWYWFDTNGAMFSGGSKYINGRYYYFDSDGVCQNP